MLYRAILENKKMLPADNKWKIDTLLLNRLRKLLLNKKRKLATIGTIG